MTDSPATASARRMLDIFVIVDTSNSMRRCDCAGIDAVSRALRKTSESFHDIVRSHDVAVNMAVLAFDDDARWVVSPQPVETVTIPALTTGMLTRLDRACIELETYLRGNSLDGNADIERDQSCAPVFLLITDGLPVCAESALDDALGRLNANTTFHRGLKAAIVIDNVMACDDLARFTGDPAMVLDVRLEDVERRITDALEQLSAKSCSQAVRPRHGTESGSEDMGATSRHEEDGNDAASAPEDIPTSESGLTPPDCVCDTLATAYRRGPKRRYYFDLVAQHIIGKRGRDPLRDDDYAELPADFFPAVDVPSRALELLGGLLVSYESIADVLASEWKYAVAAHGLYRKGADASAVILRVESTYVRSGQDVEIVIARGADGGWLVREDGICREKSLLSPHGQLDNFAFWPLWNRDPNDPDKHVPRRDGDLATLARSIRAEGWAPVNPADNESGSAYDLLLDYMRNVFVHAKAHDQIVTDGKRTIALFDTGLSRHDGKPVMCYCWRSRQLGRDKKNWLFGGFCTEDGALGEDDRRLQTKLFHLRRSGDWARLTPPVYEGRPDPAVFRTVHDHGDLLAANFNHMVEEKNIKRYPVHYIWTMLDDEPDFTAIWTSDARLTQLGRESRGRDVTPVKERAMFFEDARRFFDARPSRWSEATESLTRAIDRALADASRGGEVAYGYYPRVDEMTPMLPLQIEGVSRPVDAVLMVSVRTSSAEAGNGGTVRMEANTIFTPYMAYKAARCLGRVTQDWLRASVKTGG